MNNRLKVRSGEKPGNKRGRGVDHQLVLKATPPRLAAELLTRKRLTLSSPEFQNKSVIIIEAPSGFGKTSLLAQWRREVLRKGGVAAWLDVDERDDLLRFVLGLSVAMRLATGRTEIFDSSVYAATSESDALESLTGWLADVAGLAVDTVLMLDDCHQMRQQTRDDALNYLIQNAPPNLTVVLASRRPVELSLLDILAQGKLTRIDFESLRFSRRESIELLKRRFSSQIDTDSCMRLYERTEGWPLGLQLAVATVERSNDLQSAIDGLSAKSGDIQRFFEIYLVEGLDRELAQFLSEVAFVDSLHADFCTAITGRQDSQRLLSRLREETPIFQQVAGSDWFRMHPLAREFLHNRFNELPETRRREMHARAAHWFEAQHMFELAARHAFQAGEQQRAYQLVGRDLYEIVATGQISQVSDWIDRLPQHEIERRPQLRLAVAWTLAMSERHDAAGQLLAPLMQEPEISPDIRRECAEICATALVFTDNIDASIEMMNPWLDVDLPVNPIQRVVALNLKAIFEIYRGAPGQARFIFRNTPASLRSEAGAYANGWSDWVIGFSYLWEGKADLAVETLQPALIRAEKETGRRSPITGMLSASLATALWDQGHVRQAAAVLANRMDILVRRAPPEVIIMGHVTAAKLAISEGLDVRAWDLLEHLYAIAESRGLPRLGVVSLVEQIRMHAIRSHREMCAELLHRLEALLEKENANLQGVNSPLIRLRVLMARAYVAAVNEGWRDVLEIFEEAGMLAAELRRGREGVQIKLLRAFAHKQLGQDGSSLLHEASGLARSLGLKRIMSDTHPDISDWLHQQSDVNILTESGGNSKTAGPDTTAGSPAATVRINASALLTPKEQEVIQLLAGNMSNKEIALAMDISSETVKWHMKNLFGKLQAGTRKHLIYRARMLGVLDFIN